MKRILTPLLLVMLCCVGIASCSDDDNLDLTGINGKPSSVKRHSSSTNEESRISFYYQGDKLSRTIEEKGSIYDFSYENNELTAVDLSPEDKTVADGHGSITFKKEGSNKIVIESSWEPSFDLYRMSLDLDANGIPVKIAEEGVYSRNTGNGELSKIREGTYYALFTYNPATKALVKQTVYNSSAKIVATYTYEYDDNVGAISKIELPLWYYAYKAFGNRDDRDTYNRLFFCYSGNILRETVKTDESTSESVYNYTYQYNKKHTPVVMGSDILGFSGISIEY